VIVLYSQGNHAKVLGGELKCFNLKRFRDGAQRRRQRNGPVSAA
jgi:hypothetical protein